MKYIDIHIQNAYSGDSCRLDFSTKEDFESKNFIFTILNYLHKVEFLTDDKIKTFSYSKNLDALYFDDEPDIIYEENINVFLNECEKKFENNGDIFCFAGNCENITCWFSFNIREKEV